MLFAERANTWNRWYDSAPAEWRFQLVLWLVLALGTLNMMLTLATGFPFALLVLLGIIVIAAVRVPYVFGRAAPTGVGNVSGFQIAGADWLIDLNHRYDALPEARRFWVYPAVLLIAGAINMMLTIRYGFPFGLLFLLALLALVVFRAPYTAGYLRAAEPTRQVAPQQAFPSALKEPGQSPPALEATEHSPVGLHEVDQTPAVLHGSDHANESVHARQVESERSVPPADNPGS